MSCPRPAHIQPRVPLCELSNKYGLICGHNKPSTTVWLPAGSPPSLPPHQHSYSSYDPCFRKLNPKLTLNPSPGKTKQIKFSDNRFNVPNSANFAFSGGAEIINTHVSWQCYRAIPPPLFLFLFLYVSVFPTSVTRLKFLDFELPVSVKANCRLQEDFGG